MPFQIQFAILRMGSTANITNIKHFHPLGIGPMSDYNSDALIALRSELQTKVVMMPHLIDMLQKPAGGFMTTAEELRVRNDANQMGRLIEILLGKGDKEFDTFCDMLEKSNHAPWAHKLKQQAERLRVKNRDEGKKYGL